MRYICNQMRSVSARFEHFLGLCILLSHGVWFAARTCSF
jgi:hypothetical protein